MIFINRQFVFVSVFTCSFQGRGKICSVTSIQQSRFVDWRLLVQQSVPYKSIDILEMPSSAFDHIQMQMSCRHPSHRWNYESQIITIIGPTQSPTAGWIGFESHAIRWFTTPWTTQPRTQGWIQQWTTRNATYRNHWWCALNVHINLHIVLQFGTRLVHWWEV